MSRTRRSACVAAASIGAMVAIGGSALAAHRAIGGQAALNDAQRRGREIYTTGASTSGEEIVAFLGDDGIEVPGTILPCASCHGHDGRGNAEGGVIPADVTWSELTKPYEVTRADGRSRPPYDAAAVRRAIVEGVDAGGRALNPTMPRYGMSDADLADVVAYLEVVGAVVDPGVDATTLKIGLILPPEERLGAMGRAVRAASTAYFAEINRRGGMYGRDIELRSFSLPPSGSDQAAALRDFVDREQPFAFAAAFVAGADAEFAAMAAELQVPAVGAVSLYPDTGFPLNRYVFYLYAGVPQQGRALATYAAGEFPAESERAAIVFMPDSLSRQFADAVAATLENAGASSAGRYELSPDRTARAELVSTLRTNGTAAVFFNGPGAAALEFLSAAHAVDWNPLLFMPGSAVGSEIFSAPRAADGRVFVSFPTLPIDRQEAALLEHRSLVEAYGIPPSYPSIQFAALASARLLLEGLARSGRNLSREKLIRSLEGLYEFETGLMRPVSFGPNRRIGALGAHVAALDLEAATLALNGVWVPLQ